MTKEVSGKLLCSPKSSTDCTDAGAPLAIMQCTPSNKNKAQRFRSRFPHKNGLCKELCGFGTILVHREKESVEKLNDTYSDETAQV